MDSMSGENKNLKDSLKDNQEVPALHEAGGLNSESVTLSYTKHNKLITALFMVTDILDTAEPLRHKIRNLGAEIISDVHGDVSKLASKITAMLSFLEIAVSLKLISEMNHNILVREFRQFLDSVKEYGQVRSTWLQDFLPETGEPAQTEKRATYQYKNNFLVTGPILRTREPGTRLGVQKAGTLLKALSNVKLNASDKNGSRPLSSAPSFDLLKKERREAIVRVLKGNSEGMIITDIKAKSKGHPDQFSAIVSCGEKTLQRELVSMVKDGVLKKIGEKRWSRYMLA